MRDKEWKCIYCGKYVSYRTMDRATDYGCSSYDPPEPLDEIYFCGDCAKKEYKQALKDGLKMTNYWQKPHFQLKAMKKLGIVEKDFKLVFESAPVSSIGKDK